MLLSRRRFLAFFCIFISLSFLFVSCMKDGDILVQEGARFFNQKRFDLALEDFEKALESETSYEPRILYIYISNCYSQMGDQDLAIEWRLKALEIAEDASNYLNIGFLYRLKGDDDTAEKMYLKALELDGEDAAIYASLGSLYLTHDRIDEAVAMLEKACDIDDRSGIIHADLAICYAKQSLFDEAEDEYSLALRYKAPNIIEFRARLDELKSKAQP